MKSQKIVEETLTSYDTGQCYDDSEPDLVVSIPWTTIASAYAEARAFQTRFDQIFNLKEGATNG